MENVDLDLRIVDEAAGLIVMILYMLKWFVDRSRP